jgi:Uma2 family endonuclease
MMASVVQLLTIEEYSQLPDSGRPTELVRGRVVEMNLPKPRHGQVCARVDRIVGAYVDEHDLGHLLINDTGVITGRNPDTLRGADVAFYSYARIPKGPLPDEYLPQPPELVFEIRSPDDRWTKLLAKAAEYLDAGVSVVCVLEPKTRKAHLFYADRPTEILAADDELTFPEILGDFRVRVGRFFE